MSFSEEKKARIRHYLLEKIERGGASVVRSTADAFGITPASVYKYLDAMEKAGVLQKVKRGEYRLMSRTAEARLRRSEGALESETRVFERHILPMLSELPRNVQGIWEYLCGEMINNVIDHSEAETLEIEVRRDALQTTVRLTDDGVGIFEKIRRGFALDSLDEAVSELFKGKLTTDAAHHSGEGVFFSSRLADTFVIVSSGRVFTHNRFEEDELRRLTSQTAEDKPETNPGTTVVMTLANDSRKQAKDVFDLFADPDGGFTKTRIPLANYFESSPVSRSQAKRLVSRLDRFQEVELDFSGIEWIGQGFAHELFVVFAKSHPEVRLIPLHMNEDVKKMHTHVAAENA